MSQLQLGGTAVWVQQKSAGDDAFKAGNYQDAVNCYSIALRTKFLQDDPAESARIHCNRCLSFMYSQQWNYAVEDALLAIQLQTNWWKGARARLACRMCYLHGTACRGGRRQRPTDA